MFTKKTQLFALNVEANMITNLTPTEIEELRIAIAEECGWKKRTTEKWEHEWMNPYTKWSEPEPSPYTASIDAIQAAAVERFNTLELAYLFEGELLVRKAETKTPFQHQLTALDWCIAFARTAKIWRYKPLNETNPPRV